jgi:predicted ribosome quality control (RQC) complex YloA/Tae2 family protein
MDHVRRGEYLPVMITDERGKTVMAYPVPTLQYPPKQQHERPSLNEALDAYYRQKIGESKLETARTELLTAVQRSIASRKQTLIALRQAIADAGKADRYKNLGELVLANLGTLKKGDGKVAIINYFDPEMPEIELELDPLLTPKENADRYFRRYRKMRDAAEAAKSRVSSVEIELTILEAAREQIERVTEVPRLAEVRESLESRGVLRRETVHVPGKKAEPEFGGARIRRTTSSDGWEILYGENAESNDYLTTKVARPSDMWLHARSITGAHVVIRANNRPDAIPRSTLMEAAQIAAQNSDASIRAWSR